MSHTYLRLCKLYRAVILHIRQSNANTHTSRLFRRRYGLFGLDLLSFGLVKYTDITFKCAMTELLSTSNASLRT